MDPHALVDITTDELCAEARRLRLQRIVTYSPKVFIPLTKLCRDTCQSLTAGDLKIELGCSPQRIVR